MVKNIFRLVASLAVACFIPQLVYAEEICDQQSYDVLVSVATNNGYVWEGTRSECRAKSYGNNVAYRDALNVSSGGKSGLYVTLTSNPFQLQFSYGIVTNYKSCFALKNRIWVNTGQAKCQ